MTNLKILKMHMMKRNISKIFVAVLFFLSLLQNANGQRHSSVSFQYFYDYLSPYGDWISYPTYGYVWHPHSTVDFHPYRTKGHWVWTNEYNWLWVSDYEWGWAPFHYGRWFYDNYYGWIWIPANEWSPAWVIWRSGADFYGWSPLGPDIDISILYVTGPSDLPYYYWSFIPLYFLTSENVSDHCYHVQRNQTFLQYSKYIIAGKKKDENNRQIFVNGPSKNEWEERSRQKMKIFNTDATDKPGYIDIRENRLQIYKPNVELKDKAIARPSIIYSADNPIKQEQINKEEIQNQINIDVPIIKKPIIKEEQKEKKKTEKVVDEKIKLPPVPEKKSFEPRKDVEKKYPDKWESIRKMPEKYTAPPVNIKPVLVPRPSNLPIKRLPIKKEVIKGLP